MSKRTWLVAVLILAVALILVLIFSGPGKPISYQKLFSNDEAKGLLDVNQVAIAQGNNSASSAAVLPISDQDHILGSKSAKVKMVVYENPGELYSAKLAKDLDTILAEKNKDVMLAVRYYFPKTDTIAWQNAVALNCAASGNKFKEARELLIAKTIKKEAINWSEANEELGLGSAFLTCLQDQKIKTAIEMDLDRTKDAPIYGAPTLFIGSEIITGARSLDDSLNSIGEKLEGLRSIIQRQLGA